MMAQYSGEISQKRGFDTFTRQLGRTPSPAEPQQAAQPADHSSLRRSLAASRS